MNTIEPSMSGGKRLYRQIPVTTC